jgi:hypothetical protein
MKKPCYQIKSGSDIKDFLNELFPSPISGNPEPTGEGYAWLQKLFERFPAEFTIVVEDSHVDREYRDSYYLYFSSQHFDLSRFCTRLSFFNILLDFEMFLDPQGKKSGEHEEKNNATILQAAYIGCCTIRPIKNHEIGKTLINPKMLHEHDDGASTMFIRMVPYETTIYGMKLTVEAFPFSTQDGETTRCIENTIVNLLDYFSKKYNDYHRVLPSEVIAITHRNSIERVLPIKSTDFFILAKTLSVLGFYPRHYGLKSAQPQKLVYYYIESGIPVAIGLKANNSDIGHSVICIGHSEKGASIEEKREHIKKKIQDGKKSGQAQAPIIVDTAEFYNYFTIMDDMGQPYEEQPLNEQNENKPNCKDTDDKAMDVVNITVPLSWRMYMDASDAKTIFSESIESEKSEIGLKKQLHKKSIETAAIIRRMYLSTCRNYKSHLLNQIVGHNEYKKVLCSLPFPHFIWVCEYFFPDDYLQDTPMSFGELVLDGTSNSMKGRDSMLLYRFFDVFACRTPSEQSDVLIDRIINNTVKFEVPEKQPACLHNLTEVVQKK